MEKKKITKEQNERMGGNGGVWECVCLHIQKAFPHTSLCGLKDGKQSKRRNGNIYLYMYYMNTYEYVFEVCLQIVNVC